MILFYIVKKGTLQARAERGHCRGHSRTSESLVLRNREMAAPVLKRRCEPLRPSPSNQLIAFGVLTSIRGQAAAARTAANFSTGVRPLSAIENRTSLYTRSQSRSARAASSNRSKVERLQNSSASMR